jgi:hypothetical protein
LPDAIRAWDALLADPAGPRDALVRIAAAMVLHLRDQLLAGDFAANVKLLQAYPPADGACRALCLIGASLLKRALSCAVNDILRVAAALPRGGGAADGAGGSGPPPEWAAGGGGPGGAGGLKASSTWAERRGGRAAAQPQPDSDTWVKVTLAPQPL